MLFQGQQILFALQITQIYAELVFWYLISFQELILGKYFFTNLFCFTQDHFVQIK
jgi:hypothetical protein